MLVKWSKQKVGQVKRVKMINMSIIFGGQKQKCVINRHQYASGHSYLKFPAEIRAAYCNIIGLAMPINGKGFHYLRMGVLAHETN